MLLKVFSLLLLVLLVLSCRETGTRSNVFETAVVIKLDSSDSVWIFIVDHRGKEWDVTHAVKEYGFEPERFQYGLGANAIKPILEPIFVSPGDPEYPSVEEDDLVIGTVVNGIARAYPLNILWRHEVANEQIGDTYVAVAFWPIVNLTAVYSRVVLSRVRTLSASGWTYDDTFVLYDYENESLWYHMPGEEGLTCISGKYADRKFAEFKSTQLRWSDWFASYPETQVLIK